MPLFEAFFVFNVKLLTLFKYNNKNKKNKKNKKIYYDRFL